MSKKNRRLKDGGLVDLSHLKERHNADSVIARRKKMEEKESGVRKTKVPWTPEEDDFILELFREGRVDEASVALNWRSMRARRQRVGQLAARVAEYRPSEKRKHKYAGTPWTRFDKRILKMATTEAAIRNGASDPRYVASLLGRTVAEVINPLANQLHIEPRHIQGTADGR